MPPVQPYVEWPFSVPVMGHACLTLQTLERGWGDLHRGVGSPVCPGGYSPGTLRPLIQLVVLDLLFSWGVFAACGHKLRGSQGHWDSKLRTTLRSTGPSGLRGVGGQEC